ncbi:MAG TPA: nuclear transport factor 2 family protein [Verrucomicrobiae bacterium]|nr:nuclear transport factor 2 family protein [Verrucomicrobiae bacterium]
MKSHLLFIALLTLGFFGSNLRASESDSASALTDEIRATEALREHYVTTNDLDRLAPMLCDTLVYTHSSGHTMTKAQFLESISSGDMKYITIKIESMNIDIYNGATAVLTGTTLLHVKSKQAGEHDAHLRYILVYVKEGGQWKVAAWQSTNLKSN